MRRVIRRDGQKQRFVAESDLRFANCRFNLRKWGENGRNEESEIRQKTNLLQRVREVVPNHSAEHLSDSILSP